jgi:hypothetical protein
MRGNWRADDVCTNSTSMSCNALSCGAPTPLMSQVCPSPPTSPGQSFDSVNQAKRWIILEAPSKKKRLGWPAGRFTGALENGKTTSGLRLCPTVIVCGTSKKPLPGSKKLYSACATWWQAVRYVQRRFYVASVFLCRGGFLNAVRSSHLPQTL